MNTDTQSKPHGSTGNRNAAKPYRKKHSQRLQLAATVGEKAAWKRAARAQEQTLARWARAALNAYAIAREDWT